MGEVLAAVWDEVNRSLGEKKEEKRVRACFSASTTFSDIIHVVLEAEDFLFSTVRSA